MKSEELKSFSTSEEKLSSFQSVVSGSLSGLIVRFVIAPLDIVKIRLQLHPNSSSYSGIFSTVKTIYTNEGIRAFWKGNLPAAIMYIIYGGAQFWAYNNMLKSWESFTPKRQSENTILKNMTIGFTSGLFATASSYPFDLLRTRLASNDGQAFRSLLFDIKSIWKEKGIKGFFGGCLVSMVYVGGMTSISFGAYSTIMRIGESEDWGKISLSSIAGVSAGTISKVCVYPLDMIKRRLQMIKSGNSDLFINPSNLKGKVSPIKIAKSILQNSGVRGLYRGLAPSLIKSVPATATSLWCFEFFSTCFRKYNHKVSSLK